MRLLYLYSTHHTSPPNWLSLKSLSRQITSTTSQRFLDTSNALRLDCHYWVIKWDEGKLSLLSLSMLSSHLNLIALMAHKTCSNDFRSDQYEKFHRHFFYFNEIMLENHKITFRRRKAGNFNLKNWIHVRLLTNCTKLVPCRQFHSTLFWKITLNTLKWAVENAWALWRRLMKFSLQRFW